MIKKSILGFILIIGISFLFVSLAMYYKNNIEDINNRSDNSEYLYGEASGTKGSIKLKLKTDSSGKIKEISVTDFSSKQSFVPQALQKLINQALEKNNGNEIDTITGATDTSDTFRSAINDAVNYKEPILTDVYDRVSLKDEEVLKAVSREEVEVNRDSVKTGFGSYVLNAFTDADYNKNGNLTAHEYLCGVIIEQNGRISQVKFDHISSNINFNRLGKVPTGNVRVYRFLSDKNEPGFNGICSDGSLVNIIDFENSVLNFRFLEEIKKNFENKKAYMPFVKALELACTNAKYIGASKFDTLGISSIKELDKKDILDANSNTNENGKVTFKSNYAAITVNNSLNISSCMLDKSENIVTLTSDGKILGSRDSQIYTLNDLSNPDKYTKIERAKVTQKEVLNRLSNIFTGYEIQNLINTLSKETDDKGMPKEGGMLSEFVENNFVPLIEILYKAYLDARKL